MAELIGIKALLDDGRELHVPRKWLKASLRRALSQEVETLHDIKLTENIHEPKLTRRKT